MRQRRRFALLREVGLLAVLYVGYTVGRLFADNDLQLARSHADFVVDLERLVGLDVERTLNHILTGLPLMEVAASYAYASMHYIVTPVVLVVLWRKAPEQYAHWRRVLVLGTAIALVGYLLFPTAPPRLVPGFVDTLAETANFGWWGADASAPRGLGTTTNELAAMPSMHVGWSLWSAWALSAIVKSPGARALVWSYPLLITVVIVATANHWVLDAVVGAALIVLSARIVRPWRDRDRRAREVPRVRST
ncbi:phosphatase PAP2 family protein [Solicola gregarius]|uniref:Phosphatase PAP2 family protein n=1 Tax=Solicola gregarius TaxID=2908642 RepID=A0AA46YMZ1_9ACTN|nr:phosphatase PAP2 family protein [Solicola gregarius]UYM06956.1 phosphatase PAP2 family protein [Solicola gregarius]